VIYPGNRTEKRTYRLLEDFLSLGKLEEGKIMAEPAGLGIREFLDKVVEEPDCRGHVLRLPPVRGVDGLCRDNIYLNLRLSLLTFAM